MTRGAHGRAALRGVVALDGPSGTGKSTVARRLAGALHARYLDTGAMYRSVTLAVLRAGIDPADRAAVIELARHSVPVIGTDPAAPTVRLGAVDVAADIRGPEVTGSVSAVAGIPEVRSVLIAVGVLALGANAGAPGLTPRSASELGIVLSCACGQRMLGGNRDEGDAHDGIGARGEHPQQFLLRLSCLKPSPAP